MRCTGFSRLEWCLRHMHACARRPADLRRWRGRACVTVTVSRSLAFCWPRRCPWQAAWLIRSLSSQAHGRSVNARAHRTHSYIYALAWSPGCRNVIYLGRHITQVNKRDGTTCAARTSRWQFHVINFALCPPIFSCKYICERGSGAQPRRKNWLLTPGCSRQRCICQLQSGRSSLLPHCYPLSRLPPCPFSIHLTITPPQCESRVPTAGVEPA